MPVTTLTSKGQVTIPKSIREFLRVGPGDRVVFYTAEDGRVIMEPETVDIRSLRGVIKPGRRGVTVEQMKESIEHHGSGT
ncbi:MAG: type II toxin-antitoxin system PrlF family antitoxin [Bradymonadales bacterium]|nr:type II toxin-antitoxin system PrlF family antitoxin [Bradymonadales bacterium]